MPTVIDSLVVVLGLDPSKFTEGQKQAVLSLRKTEEGAEHTAKSMQSSGKKAAEFFSSIRNQALALTTALLGGMGLSRFAEHITQSDAAVGRMAKNVGMNTKELSAWQGAVQRAGGTSEGVTGSIKGLSRQFEMLALTGNSEMIPFLTAAHVNLAKFFDTSVPMTDKLLELADAFQGMAPSKAQAIGAGLGLDEGTINLLMQGRVAVLDLLDKQKQLNAASEEDAKLAQKRQKEWQDLSDRFVGMARRILTDLTPAIETALGWLEKFITFANEHLTLTEVVLGSIVGLFSTMAAISFAKLALSVMGIVPVLAAASTAAAPLLPIIAALAAGGAVGTGIGMLINKGVEKISGGRSVGSLLFDATHADPMRAPPQLPLDYTKFGKGGGLAANSLFSRLERQHGLPEGLLDSMWAQESARGQKMLSPKGAKGHFGFMDPTAKQYGLKDPNDLTESASAAARMMHDMLRWSGGNLPKALAGYNWGAGNVQNFGLDRAPLETLNYMQQVPARMSGASSTSHADVRVGEVNVYTRATDGPGIAKDIGQSLREYAFASQANTGLQ